MSTITKQIERIENAKIAMHTSIANKHVVIPEGIKIEDYLQYLRAITNNCVLVVNENGILLNSPEESIELENPIFSTINTDTTIEEEFERIESAKQSIISIVNSKTKTTANMEETALISEISPYIDAIITEYPLIVDENNILYIEKPFSVDEEFILSANTNGATIGQSTIGQMIIGQS